MASTWKLTKKLKETHLTQAFLRGGNNSNNSSNNAGTTANSDGGSSVNNPSTGSGVANTANSGGAPHSPDLGHSAQSSYSSSVVDSEKSPAKGNGSYGFGDARNNTLVAGQAVDDLATPRATVSASGQNASVASDGSASASRVARTGIDTNTNPALLRVKISEIRNLDIPADVKRLLPAWAADTTSTRPPPVHLVLEYDKTQILLHSIGGTVNTPVWDKTSAFDLSANAPTLNIQLYVRVYDQAAGSEDRDPILASDASSSSNHHKRPTPSARETGSSSAAAAAAALAATSNSGNRSSIESALSGASLKSNASDATHSHSHSSASASSIKTPASSTTSTEQSPSKSKEKDKGMIVRDVLLGSARLVLPKSFSEPITNASISLGPAQPGKLRLSCEIHNTRNKPLSIDDFTLLKVVGKGSFGKVMQVRKKDTRQIYALKTIRKAHIVSRSEVGHTLAERTVLAKINNPFIVPLKFSFQSPEKLYLVLAFVNGGELFHHLQREGRFDLNRSRFYTAELLCALECLHEYNVIYRDLKPENILLDYTGHIALCDFGLCKLNMTSEQKTNTFCGTPEYLAPELLLGLGYTKAVDWWTLGVLFYEMLTGLPPFYDQDTNTMYHKIVQDPLTFPSDMDREARSLLQGLLNRDPKLRLGVNGAAEIKAHPFFRQIDWKYLLNKKYVAPFQPSVVSATDTSNFDQEFTSEVPTDSVVGTDSLLTESVQKQFGGWSYSNDSRLASSGKW